MLFSSIMRTQMERSGIPSLQVFSILNDRPLLAELRYVILSGKGVPLGSFLYNYRFICCQRTTQLSVCKQDILRQWGKETGYSTTGFCSGVQRVDLFEVVTKVVVNLSPRYDLWYSVRIPDTCTVIWPYLSVFTLNRRPKSVRHDHLYH